MNKTQKNYLLLTGMLALGAVIVVLWKPGVHESEDVMAGKPVLDETQIPTVNKLTITKGQDSLNLEKGSDGYWRMTSDNNFPADASRVASFLDDLSKTKFQRSIANAEKSWSDFGLDGATSVVLQAAGKDVLHLNLGSTRSGGGGQYVSMQGEAKTAYFVDREIRADTATGAWENKLLIDVKPESVKKVEFVGKNKTSKPLAIVSREKAEDKLTLQETTPRDKILLDAMDGVSRILSGMRYQKRLHGSNEEAKTALNQSFLTRVFTFEGRELEIRTGSIGQKDKQKFFVKINSSATSAASPDDARLKELMDGWFFEISGYEAKRLQKTKKDFFEGSAG